MAMSRRIEIEKNRQERKNRITKVQFLQCSWWQQTDCIHIVICVSLSHFLWGKYYYSLSNWISVVTRVGGNDRWSNGKAKIIQSWSSNLFSTTYECLLTASDGACLTTRLNNFTSFHSLFSCCYVSLSNDYNSTMSLKLFKKFITMEFNS